MITRKGGWFVFIVWDCSAGQLVVFPLYGRGVLHGGFSRPERKMHACMRLKNHSVRQTLAKLIIVYGSVYKELLVISSWPVGTLM